MASPSWRQDWVTEKSQIAIRLSRGEAGAGYAEAAILLCAMLSALAAETWAGRGIDRARFIELLVRIGPTSEDCKTISVPLLVQHLAASSRQAEAQTLERAFSYPAGSRIVTGPDVDRAEADVLTLCPTLDLKEVRRFSYAFVLYSEVRSSYAHEYRAGNLANSWPATTLEDQKVSYVNLFEAPSDTRRQVHFHVEWFAQLAAQVALTIDGIASTLPRAQPPIWWCDGG
jgi:hypothetical protein